MDTFDNQSMSSYQQSQSESQISKSKKKKKEMTAEDAEMNKKKMKVLKEALKEFKTKDEKKNAEILKLQQDNESLKRELKEKVTENQDIFEENHKLHDSILVLQQKMSDEFGLNMDVNNDVADKKEAKSETKNQQKNKSASKVNEDTLKSQILDNLDEQAMIDQMNASNMAAEALIKAEEQNQVIMD